MNTGNVDALCLSFSPVHGAETSVNQKPTVEKLVQGYNAFAFNLFSEITRRNVKENVFISPVGAAVVLSMAYNGAEGGTKTEMERALQIPGIDLTNFNSVIRDLFAAVANPVRTNRFEPQLSEAEAKRYGTPLSKSGAKTNKTIVEFSNSIWITNRTNFKVDFRSRMSEYFQADSEVVDFSDKNTSTRINDWIHQKTHGRISGDRSFPSDTEMLLLNVVYFKADWATRFEASLTKKLPFNLLGGSRKDLPRMFQQVDVPYFETGNFQAVSVPYATGEKSMILFLPGTNSSLASFLRELNPQHWSEWQEKFREAKVSLGLPKFRLNYEIQLKEYLMGIGIKKAFGIGTANFSGISDEPLNIDELLQKTYANVDEDGTTMIAFGAEFLTRYGNYSTPVQMIIDRPFFFAIKDDLTGLILSMGAIVDPE